jgi:hypothetical protein
MIGQQADAGDNFKKRASIPLAPCTVFLKEIGYQKILPLVLDQPFNAQGIENLLPVTLSVFQNYSQSN